MIRAHVRLCLKRFWSHLAGFLILMEFVTCRSAICPTLRNIPSVRCAERSGALPNAKCCLLNVARRLMARVFAIYTD